MTTKQKKVLIRIIIAFILFVLLGILFHDFGGGEGSFFERMISGTDLSESALTAIAWAEPLLYLIVYLIAGYDVLLKAGKNIANGHIFDENFLMIVAGIGAFVIGEYSEGVAVMLFYQVGELFQSYAVGKSRRSISAMMEIVPEYANVFDEGGHIEEVDPEDVQIGTVILIKPGEKVPIDCRVIEGETYLDTSALTGESVPRHAKEGDEILSGFINGDGTIKCVTVKAYVDSAVSVILELVENAGSRKSTTEKFITKFAKYYTPVVTVGALILAVVPSIITGDWYEWIRRACTFLVISCPCALVVSVPLGFFGGIGAASKIGVLIKGSNFLEAVSQAKAIAFDKTGTLTKGVFEVAKVVPAEMKNENQDAFKEAEIITLAAAAEQFSNHPIAQSIMKAYADISNVSDDVKDGLKHIGGLNINEASDARNTAGRGVSAQLGGKTILVGNAEMMSVNSVEHFDPKTAFENTGTVCHVAYDGKYAGFIVISDTVKENAASQIAMMKQAGIEKTIMLTGDNEATAMKIAAGTGTDAYFAELLPADKVTKVEEIISTLGEKEKLIFVGDGINDAPVLMRADVGIAMGKLGSDAAIEAADVVIMDDDLSKIPLLLRIAVRTMRIVKENIVFALGVKLLILVLGALGIAGMWLAVFADVGVAVLAILNSMRAMRVKSAPAL